MATQLGDAVKKGIDEFARSQFGHERFDKKVAAMSEKTMEKNSVTLSEEDKFNIATYRAEVRDDPSKVHSDDLATVNAERGHQKLKELADKGIAVFGTLKDGKFDTILVDHQNVKRAIENLAEYDTHSRQLKTALQELPAKEQAFALSLADSGLQSEKLRTKFDEQAATKAANDSTVKGTHALGSVSKGLGKLGGAATLVLGAVAIGSLIASGGATGLLIPLLIGGGGAATIAASKVVHSAMDVIGNSFHQAAEAKQDRLTDRIAAKIKDKVDQPLTTTLDRTILNTDGTQRETERLEKQGAAFIKNKSSRNNAVSHTAEEQFVKSYNDNDGRVLFKDEVKAAEEAQQATAATREKLKVVKTPKPTQTVPTDAQVDNAARAVMAQLKKDDALLIGALSYEKGIAELTGKPGLSKTSSKDLEEKVSAKLSSVKYKPFAKEVALKIEDLLASNTQRVEEVLYEKIPAQLQKSVQNATDLVAKIESDVAEGKSHNMSGLEGKIKDGAVENVKAAIKSKQEDVLGKGNTLSDKTLQQLSERYVDEKLDTSHQMAANIQGVQHTQKINTQRTAPQSQSVGARP